MPSANLAYQPRISGRYSSNGTHLTRPKRTAHSNFPTIKQNTRADIVARPIPKDLEWSCNGYEPITFVGYPRATCSAGGLVVSSFVPAVDWADDLATISLMRSDIPPIEGTGIIAVPQDHPMFERPAGTPPIEVLRGMEIARDAILRAASWYGLIPDHVRAIAFIITDPRRDAGALRRAICEQLAGYVVCDMTDMHLEEELEAGPLCKIARDADFLTSIEHARGNFECPWGEPGDRNMVVSKEAIDRLCLHMPCERASVLGEAWLASRLCKLWGCCAAFLNSEIEVCDDFDRPRAREDCEVPFYSPFDWADDAARRISTEIRDFTCGMVDVEGDVIEAMLGSVRFQRSSERVLYSTEFLEQHFEPQMVCDGDAAIAQAADDAAQRMGRAMVAWQRSLYMGHPKVFDADLCDPYRREAMKREGMSRGVDMSVEAVLSGKMPLDDVIGTAPDCVNALHRWGP